MFVEINNLVKIYGKGDAETRVIDNLSVSLEKGELCTLLGASGSGKSTLLNTLGGLEKTEGGSIFVEGQEITKLKASQLTEYRRKSLGFVFQFYNLIGDLSVKENIEVGANISKKPFDIDKLIEDLGLEAHKDKLPGQLSGGQQQRCAIGRALVKNPKLLLCDEPTGALDYKTSKEILELIEKVVEKYKTTVIIATHNEEITNMAQRILRIKDGKIFQDIHNDNIVKAKDLEW